MALLRALASCLVFGACLLCTVGATSRRLVRTGGPGLPGGPGGRPGGGGAQCGFTAASRSAKITVKAGKRVMASNGCPGYQWYVNRTTTVANATAQTLTLKFPLSPKISTTKTYVGFSTASCKLGPIGVALNGVPFFSDCDGQSRNALIYEGYTFDVCGGHATPVNGQYHYHVVPGVTNAGSINSTRNNKFKYCKSSFWKQTKGKHSPLIGFMADGIPIYGPLSIRGKVPADLDDCNGHTHGPKSFYHYHATSDVPFLVGCLKGCVSKTDWPTLGTASCSAASVQYNYSSLANVKAA